MKATVTLVMKSCKALRCKELQVFFTKGKQDFLGIRRELSSGEDINDLELPGLYLKPGGISVVNGVNTFRARILVCNAANASYGLVQIWVDTYSNKLYLRTKSSPSVSWSDWAHILDSVDESWNNTFKWTNNSSMLSNILGAGLDLSTISWTSGKSINEQGVINESAPEDFMISDYIPIENIPYFNQICWSICKLSTLDNNTRIHSYDANGNWLKQESSFIPGISKETGKVYTYTFTPHSDAAFIRISTNTSNMITSIGYYHALERFLSYQEVLTAEDDLHNLSKAGTYSIRLETGIPKNFPINVSSNTNVYRLLVIKSMVSDSNHMGEFHIVTTPSAVYIETYNASISDFNPWIRIPYWGLSYKDARTSDLRLHFPLEDDESGIGAYNAVRRARQLSDIIWTPKADIPREFFETNDIGVPHGGSYWGKFSTGKTYTGVPYSSDHDLGITVPIQSFVTALDNEMSAIYQGNQGEGHPEAVCYYGVVCTGLTAYALNLPEIISNYWKNIEGMQIIYESISKTSTSVYGDIKIGDILQTNGHCAIITDILREYVEDQSFWRRTGYEVTEAGRTGNFNRNITDGPFGGCSRRRKWTMDNFRKAFNNYSVLRYEYINTVPYKNDPYDSMPGDMNYYCYHDLPVMPYEGNYSTYLSSGTRKVKLLVNSSGYTHVRIYKGDSIFSDVLVPSTTEPQDNFVEVICDSDESIYTAMLITKDANDVITSQTISCTWYIRPVFSTSFEIVDSIIHVAVSGVKSNVFHPWYVAFGDSSSDSTTRQRHGQFQRIFDYTETVTNGNSVFEFDVNYPSSNNSYIRIALQSEDFGSYSLAYRIT